MRGLGAMQSCQGVATRTVRRPPPGLDMLTWNCGGLSTTDPVCSLTREICHRTPVRSGGNTVERGIPISIPGLESPELGHEGAQRRNADPDSPLGLRTSASST